MENISLPQKTYSYFNDIQYQPNTKFVNFLTADGFDFDEKNGSLDFNDKQRQQALEISMDNKALLVDFFSKTNERFSKLSKDEKYNMIQMEYYPETGDSDFSFNDKADDYFSTEEQSLLDQMFFNFKSNPNFMADYEKQKANKQSAIENVAVENPALGLRDFYSGIIKTYESVFGSSKKEGRRFSDYLGVDINLDTAALNDQEQSTVTKYLGGATRAISREVPAILTDLGLTALVSAATAGPDPTDVATIGSAAVRTGSRLARVKDALFSVKAVPHLGSAIVNTASMFGSYAKEAEYEGKSPADQVQYALPMALLETTTDRLFGSIPFFKSTKITDELLEAGTKRIIQKSGINLLTSSVGEGAGEVFQDILSPVIKAMVYNDLGEDEARKQIKDSMKYAIENQPSLKQLADSFIVGMLAGGIGQGVFTTIESGELIKEVNSYKKAKANTDTARQAVEKSSNEYQKITADISNLNTEIQGLRSNMADSISRKNARLISVEDNAKNVMGYTNEITLKRKSVEQMNAKAQKVINAINTNTIKLNASISEYNAVLNSLKSRFNSVITQEAQTPVETFADTTASDITQGVQSISDEATKTAKETYVDVEAMSKQYESDKKDLSIVNKEIAKLEKQEGNPVIIEKLNKLNSQKAKLEDSLLNVDLQMLANEDVSNALDTNNTQYLESNEYTQAIETAKQAQQNYESIKETGSPSEISVARSELSNAIDNIKRLKATVQGERSVLQAERDNAELKLMEHNAKIDKITQKQDATVKEIIDWLDESNRLQDEINNLAWTKEFLDNPAYKEYKLSNQLESVDKAIAALAISNPSSPEINTLISQQEALQNEYAAVMMDLYSDNPFKEIANEYQREYEDSVKPDYEFQARTEGVLGFIGGIGRIFRNGSVKGEKLQTLSELVEEYSKKLNINLSTTNYDTSARLYFQVGKRIKEAILANEISKIDGERLIKFYKAKGDSMRRSSGYYRNKSGDIKLRSKGRIDVASHEIGHALAKRYDLENVNSIQDGVDTFFFGSKTLNTKAYADEKHAAEAVAEFFNSLIVNGATETASISPTFYADIMNALENNPKAKNDLNAIIELQGKVEKWYSATVGEQVDARIKSRTEKKGFIAKTLNPANTKNRLKTFEVRSLDSAILIEDMQTAVKSAGIDAKQTPYQQLLNARMYQNIAENFVNGDGVYDPDNPNELILDDSLRRIMQDCKSQENFKLLKRYLYLYNEYDRINQGVPSAQFTIEQVIDEISSVEKQYPEVVSLSDRFYNFEKTVRNVLLRDKNLVSHETTEAWDKKFPHYFPNMRPTTSRNSKMYRENSNQGLYKGEYTEKARHKTDSDVYDPFENAAIKVMQQLQWNRYALTGRTIHEFYQDVVKQGGGHVIDDFIRQITPDDIRYKEIMKQIGDVDELAQSDEVDPETQEHIKSRFILKLPNGRNVFTFKDENGENVFYESDNDLFIEGIRSMNPQSISGVLKIAGKVRTAVTKNFTFNSPAFALKVPMRAILTGWERSGQLNPFAYINYLRIATKDRLKNSESWTEFQRLGQQGGTWAQAVGRDRGAEIYEKLYDFNFEEDTTQEKIKSNTKKVIRSSSGFAYNTLSQVDGLVKYAEYKRQRDMGTDIQKAFYEAQNVTENYGRIGSDTANNKVLSVLFLFFNPARMDFSNQIRMFKKSERHMLKARLIKQTTMYVLLPMIAAALFGDDEDYENIPDYIKNSNFVFKIGNKYMLMPLPRTIPSSFCSIMANETIKAMKREPDAWKNTLADLSQALLPTLITDSFAPITMGTDSFGNAVESRSMQGLPVSERYNENTSKGAKFLSQIGLDNFGLSPQKIDALVKSLGGYWGGALVEVFDSVKGDTFPYLSRKISNAVIVNPEVSNENRDKFYDYKEILSQIDRVYKERNMIPNTNDKELRTVYTKAKSYLDQYNRLSRIASNINKVKNNGNMSANKADEEMKKIQKQMYALVEESEGFVLKYSR
jgi:hypothetical protein